MKKSIISLLVAGILSIFVGCIIDDEECLDSGNCNTEEKSIENKPEDNEVIVTGCAESDTPVCGSDGKTYEDLCDAEAAGVEEYTLGKCEPIITPRPICDTVGQFGPKTPNSHCWDEFDENGCYEVSVCY